MLEDFSSVSSSYIEDLLKYSVISMYISLIGKLLFYLIGLSLLL